MKNNNIYWIKVKTPSVLDEIFNSNLISQYKKLSLIDYGTANSSVYDYNFDDDRSFWVQANGLSDILSMLSTISVEFSTPILSFHDGSFAVFNSLGKKVELDDDVKTDFRKTCRVIEMQTGYFFDLEDDYDHEHEDLEDELFNDIDEIGNSFEEEKNETDYQFNFYKNNADENEEEPFDMNQEGGCGCDNCQCNLGDEDSEFEEEKINSNDEKTKEEIIKELFEIASQEEYDNNSSQEEMDASNLTDTFMEALNEEINNAENEQQSKTDINDILKFFNDDDSKKNNTKIEINEISLNEKFEPEINVVEITMNNEEDDSEKFSFEEFNLADCENEFDKLVNQTSNEYDNQENQFECNEQDCTTCSGSCFSSKVSDDCYDIDNFAVETFKFDDKEEKEKEDYFQSQVDDFSIYEYEEACCEDKLEYYIDSEETSIEKNEFNLEEEKIMKKELDKDIEGFKEIGFEEIEKALKQFFNSDNSLESVSDSTKDDVDNILKRIEDLREKNNTDKTPVLNDIDLKPIYESLKNGDVTLDIYTDESQKYIIEKLNGLLDNIQTNKTSNDSKPSEENIFNASEVKDSSQGEIVDNGELIILNEIIASDLNLDNNNENFYEDVNPFNWEKFEFEKDGDQFKNIDDVIESKFGNYHEETFANIDSFEDNFENIDDVMNSKFGGYQSPITSYGFVKNDDNSPIDEVLEEKFGFYSSEDKTESNSVTINNEITSNIDSVLDEKFGGYNISNNDFEVSVQQEENKFENNYVSNEDFYWNKSKNNFDLKYDTIVEVEPTGNDFEFYQDNNLFSETVINEENVDSFDDSINDLEIEQESKEFTPYFESENLFDKFNQSVGEESLVDLTVFDKPEEINTDSIENIEDAFESSETLFDDNITNMFDLEHENLYKDIYQDVVLNDNNFNDALKVNDDLTLSNNEISFETKPFENDVLNKPKQESKKTNIDDLFKYDHSRIDLERIKANSESQRAIISGLSEFLKKIEIEKNKLQQKREEIEKKNQLAKQIINQGYEREKSFDFEKRNWR